VYDGEWNESIVNKGINVIIEKLHENYFDNYEAFIIYKFHTSKPLHQQIYKESLEEYYTFIAAFEFY
jgi:hypothetical protein